MFFIQDSLNYAFLNENLNHRRTRTAHFFPIAGHFFLQNQGTFLLFSKKGRRELPALPLASCAAVYARRC